MRFAVTLFCPRDLSAAFVICLAALLPGGEAQAQTSVRLVLDRKIDETAAPFFVAIDKGYFKAEGINVMIVEPVSPAPDDASNDAVRRIAAGDAEMGFGDMNALIRARGEDPPVPVKAVFVVYNKPGYAVIGRKSRGVLVPRDLEGRKLGTPRRDPSSALWNIFAKANGIDPGKVTTENIGLPVRDPMLAAGQVDAVTALSYDSYIDLKNRGVPAADITVMLMADFGVPLYGHSIMASEKFARDNPEIVRSFLRAFGKGLKEMIARPEKAIESVLKRDPSLHKDVELERLKLTIRDNIRTLETKANGYGAIDPLRFEGGIEQLASADGFKQKPKAEDVFDGSFLPPRQKE